MQTFEYFIMSDRAGNQSTARRTHTIVHFKEKIINQLHGHKKQQISEKERQKIKVDVQGKSSHVAGVCSHVCSKEWQIAWTRILVIIGIYQRRFLIFRALYSSMPFSVPFRQMCQRLYLLLVFERLDDGNSSRRRWGLSRDPDRIAGNCLTAWQACQGFVVDYWSSSQE